MVGVDTLGAGGKDKDGVPAAECGVVRDREDQRVGDLTEVDPFGRVSRVFNAFQAKRPHPRSRVAAGAIVRSAVASGVVLWVDRVLNV